MEEREAGMGKAPWQQWGRELALRECRKVRAKQQEYKNFCPDKCPCIYLGISLMYPSRDKRFD